MEPADNRESQLDAAVNAVPESQPIPADQSASVDADTTSAVEAESPTEQAPVNQKQEYRASRASTTRRRSGYSSPSKTQAYHPTRRQDTQARARVRARQANQRRSARATHADAGVSGFISRHRLHIGIVLGVFLVFFFIGLVDQVVNGGKIYPGVHIGTIDVSGMTVEEATAAVDKTYGSKVSGNDVNIYADQATYEKAKAGQDIEDLQDDEYVSVDEAAGKRKVWTTNAAELQARIYSSQLAEQAYQVGRDNGGMGARMSAQTLGYDIEPTLQISDSAIERLASSIDRSIGKPHEDCDVVFVDGEAQVTEGKSGREVNRVTLRDAIAAQLLGQAEEDGIVAAAEDAPIRITKEAAQAVADRINAGIAYGATFTFEGTTWDASSYDLSDMIETKTTTSVDGEWKLEASYDESYAKAIVLKNLNSTYNKQNVKVEFVKSGDEVSVKTDATGTMPEVGKAVVKLQELTLDATPSSKPTIEVSGTQIPASMSIEAAMDYGLITTISSYVTEYTGGATNRNDNIHLAADLINNSIIKGDGGTWSFNEVAGECNEEKGFKGAGAIIGGEIVDDIGGGICQVATTVFNAVYEAGFPVDERQNHSLYIASYPSGRDAAIDWPSLDLVWHNDTANDVLMQTSWDDTTVTVNLIGVDPGYTVESEEGEFKDGEKHQTRTEFDNSLAEGETQVKQSGVDGSSIEVVRTVRDSSGNIVRKDTFTSVYDSQDEIILVGPNTEVDSSTSAESEDDAEAEGGDGEEESEDYDDGEYYGDEDEEYGY